MAVLQTVAAPLFCLKVTQNSISYCVWLSNHISVIRFVYKLITLGIDRCGKTTQCGLLANYLSSENATMANKLTAESIRFPNRTSTIGSLINEYLTNATSTINDNTIHLLFSANRWEASNDIESKLLSGCNLVRRIIFYLTSLGYQLFLLSDL